MPSHKHAGFPGDTARTWRDIVSFFDGLADGNEAFRPLAVLARRITESVYVERGLSGLTSMHDLLIGQSRSVLANPYLRIAWDFEQRVFVLTYEDGSREPWSRTASADDAFGVLERFFTKRARWYPGVSFSRSDAIRVLCEKALAALSAEDRAEQLSVMTVEGWDDDPGWAGLPDDLQQEFAEAREFTDPTASRYDAVLLIWLTSTFAGATNAYLLEQLRTAGVAVSSVEGDEPELISCPCCGLRTLSSRGDYGICHVCWWEDDGQDNDKADVVFGGPNYHLSLTAARRNYLTQGISDPVREDLRKLQEPADKFRVGRVFELSADQSVISERDTGWSVEPQAVS